MDESAILGLLVVATALNSLVILVLAGATIRSRASTDRSADRQAPSPGMSADADPLAGAISAFLTRSDGLFRTGGSAVEPAPATPAGALPPDRAWSPPAPAIDGASASAPPPASAPLPASAPAPAAAPSRPVRYVASAPRPMSPRPILEARIEPGPSSQAPIVTPAHPTPASPASVHASDPAHTASRVSVWFVGRDASRSTVQPSAVARLGPVIGGLLRERTRAEDEVEVDGGGRFAVTLPDTPVDGAAALTRRLADSCDAWLAAEEPPLRLEFGMTELVGRPGRPGGRRSIATV